MSKVIGYLGLLAAIFLIASCSSGSSSGSSSRASSHTSATPQASSASQSIAPKPTAFTSTTYGYTLTVPAGLTSRQAFAKWDGESELNGDSAEVDLIGDPGDTSGVWAAAAPSKRDLVAETAYAITWNAHYHGDYCPQRPDITTRITVGGQPGVLLAYNCGILVNTAVTVAHGVDYWFVFVDRSVAAATTPTDHATFMKILSSVQFSG